MSPTQAVPRPDGEPRRTPGPRGVVRNAIRFARDPLGFVGDLVATHGDIASFRLPNRSVVVVNHPHHVRRVLQDNIANYSKASTATRMVEPFLGHGLATVSDTGLWRRNRRLLQPAFHRARIRELGALMGETVEDMSVVRALFDMDPDSSVIRRFTEAVRTSNHELGEFMKAPLLPLAFPSPGHRRFWRGIADMNEIVYGVIDRYREHPGAEDGILALLMGAEDAETGARMDRRELRDEVFTMLFAGHETSAATLTWLWYELARHPEIEERVRTEACAALDGRTATTADLPRLPYTKQVIQETLRCYPPTWQNFRSVVADDAMDGYRIPAGTQLFFSLYHMHRHPDFWDDPETFDPDRFDTAHSASRDRSAYLPFGAGSRICSRIGIGNDFAMTEMQIAVATIIQRFRLAVPTEPAIAPKPLVTLGTSSPVTARLRTG